MMVQLVPMAEADYVTYLEASTASYADEKVKAGNWKPEEALSLSQEEFHKLLPDGLATKDNYLYSIVDEATGEKVGILWVAVVTRGKQTRAFVYDFAIDEDKRRHGYGTQAFLALEDKVKALGLDTIGLHVFGHNHAAIALYEKLGYVATNINMERKLSG